MYISYENHYTNSSGVDFKDKASAITDAFKKSENYKNTTVYILHQMGEHLARHTVDIRGYLK